MSGRVSQVVAGRNTEDHGEDALAGHDLRLDERRGGGLRRAGVVGCFSSADAA